MTIVWDKAEQAQARPGRGRTAGKLLPSSPQQRRNRAVAQTLVTSTVSRCPSVLAVTTHANLLPGDALYLDLDTRQSTSPRCAGSCRLDSPPPPIRLSPDKPAAPSSEASQQSTP